MHLLPRSPRLCFILVTSSSVCSIIALIFLFDLKLPHSKGNSSLRRRGILSRHSVLASEDQNGAFRVLRKIQKLEAKLLYPEDEEKTILIRGQSLLVSRDVGIYTKAALGKSPVLDTTASRVNMVEVNSSVYYAYKEDNLTRNKVHVYNWKLIICLTNTDGDSSACLPRKLFPQLQPYQKVNRIPGLKNTFWKEEKLCDFLLSSFLVTPLRSLFLPCYVLPEHSEHLSAAAHALPDTFEWVHKRGKDSRVIKVIENQKLLENFKEKSFRKGDIVQVHWLPPLKVYHNPVSVHLFVLITSLQPLRVHLHSSGQVFFHQPSSKGYGKIPERQLSWKEFLAWIERNHGNGAVKTLLRNTETAVANAALVMDTILPTKQSFLPDKKTRSRCEQCFQLISLKLIYNTSFSPAIIHINGQPNLPLLPQYERQNLIKDLLDLVLTDGESVAKELQEVLQEAADNVGIVGVDCLISHDICLTPSDLIYLLQMMKEPNQKIYYNENSVNYTSITNMKSELANNGVGFRLVYPSSNGNAYSPVIEELYEAVLKNRSAHFGKAQYLLNPVNYSLGLGTNCITLAVVDISHSEPWTVNTYNITITRHEPTKPHYEVISMSHEVCSFIQECDLRFSTKEDCGLRKEGGPWISFQVRTSSLPLCRHGDSRGRWVLPCFSCATPEDCDWSLATWQPFDCRYAHILGANLRKCLEGKKLLFIGDSTNRGLFYRLIERSNSSLMEWDKVHDLKVIKTTFEAEFGFAYYPKFWLPSTSRPVLDKVFYQLLSRFGPLRNDTSTVIVVGGVQWMAAQHLHMVSTLLLREGLQGARVIVKTLASGFHVPVPGMHSVHKKDYPRVFQQSMSLSKYARHKGYQVIDTFNITVARYRHFLSGKCACHFHKVESHTLNGIITYHVVGEINDAYGNILENAICSMDEPPR